MDSPKQNYHKYKCKVKIWERSFKKIHGRIPSKHDIHEAPNDIRHAYKMYYKLKTSFLEDTLNDVLSEDGFDILDCSQGEGNSIINSSIELPKGMADLVNNDTNPDGFLFSNVEELNHRQNHSITKNMNVNDDLVIKEFESVEESDLNKNAWNKNVSHGRKEKNKSLQKQQFKSNLSAKLFSSTSFSKRNPRKSLSRTTSTMTRSRSSLDVLSLESTQSQEMLPDLETILSQKSQQKSQSDLTAIMPKLPNETKTEVDRKWLERCQKDNSLNDNSLNNKNSLYQVEGNPNKFGLSNINVVSSYLSRETVLNESEKLPSIKDTNILNNDDSDSVVSNSEDENAIISNRHIAKRRRILKDVDINKRPQTQEIISNSELDCVPIELHGEILENTDELKSKPTSKKTVRKRITKAPRKTKPNKGSTKKNIIRKFDRGRKKISYCESNSSEDQTKDVDNAEELNDQFSNKSDHKNARIVNASNSASTKPKSVKTATTKRPSKGENSRERTLDANIEELDESNKPDDYTICLDMGDLKSLPRINIEELSQAETTLNKYINTSKRISSSKISRQDYKQTVAKNKLEAKVTAGKLNENFVRLNMKKKIFARGKKTFNYGKYKKTLWKQKKEAALSGQDMDMRGCDGGILTCFKCGKPGHFAQQCKVKGDHLLPLGADVEDESCFPTLEEAERMATQQAPKAHSKNIDNMPKVSNTLMYKDDDASANEMELVLETEEALISDTITEPSQDVNNSFAGDLYIGHKIPEDFLKKSGLLESATKNNEIEPLYKLKSDGSVLDVTDEVLEILRMFGHQSFRKNQDKAIMRILTGLSTLVTLSTGSGKSLCYQLPAYLYSRKRKAITLVISPLVSLMEDQVHGVPVFIRAHCLHTNQTPQQRLKVLELVNKGEVDVLLVSPEAVVAGEKSTGFGAILRNLPPIAFACIDEAHCVSQWSHNFRPSYLMICKVLRQKLGVRTILGLTATATFTTRESIIRHLDIQDGQSGVISDTPLPDNLILSVSKDCNRDNALIKLLRSERFDSCQSIIIYCTRRDECERIACFIRTCLQDKNSEKNNSKKRKRINWNAEPYHAGMPASRRRTIQKAFMGNQLRIVVATIAFGMGINKSDIRAVIHYNMPRNFESYVQEVGRAGRDGKISHCHLFLDPNDKDQSELRRHIYANSIDRHVIRKLLQKICNPCACEKNLKNERFIEEHSKEIKASQEINWDADFNDDSTKQTKRERKCPGHEIGFSIENAVQSLDIPEENISTLLCYLELDGRWSINILSNAYIMAKVISYGGSQYLKKAAQICPPLAMAIALELKKGTFSDSKNIIEFSVIDIASAIGWNSGVVKHQLKNLEWTTVDGLPKRSSISVDYYELGFRLRCPGDFTDDELDEALDSLYNRTIQQEKTQLIQLQCIFEGLSSVAHETCISCCDKDYPENQSNKLKKIIREYFKSDYQNNIEIKQLTDTTPDEQIINDVRTMINIYPENNFTGRAIARIFHGISSPNFPAFIWGRCKYWRGYAKSDFNRLVRLSNLTIVKMRT